MSLLIDYYGVRSEFSNSIIRNALPESSVVSAGLMLAVTGPGNSACD